MALLFLPFTFVVLISVFYKSIAEMVPMKRNNNNDGFCDRGCKQEINTAIDYASRLNQDQTTNRDNLVRRINALENQMTTALGIGTNQYNRNIGNNNNNKGNSGAAMDVYYNLTKRIDNLQYGSINNLVSDNNMWRQNFRVVNATFEKIKLTTNKCVCRSY